MPQPMQVVLVEHDEPEPATKAEISRRIAGCLSLRNARWVRSFVSADGGRTICQFEAPDAETVREAFRAAGHPFHRAWVAQMWWREE